MVPSWTVSRANQYLESHLLWQLIDIERDHMLLCRLQPVDNYTISFDQGLVLGVRLIWLAKVLDALLHLVVSVEPTAIPRTNVAYMSKRHKSHGSH